MKSPLALAALVLILLAFAVIALRLGARSDTGSYRGRKLMTENEREFFWRLRRALPGYHVFPQVAMTALLEPASRNRRQAHADRLRIAQQRIDYVVCDPNCEVVAVIELDDRTHSAARDLRRDARLEQGGVRSIRFQSRHKPTVEAIRAAVLPAEPSLFPGSARPMPQADAGRAEQRQAHAQVIGPERLDAVDHGQPGQRGGDVDRAIAGVHPAAGGGVQGQ
ncbi:hypothetical protein B0920_23680 [Massilia sp. KIM]|nr:hypothetical protein B0920_23680 [Massilia sp. KIM]